MDNNYISTIFNSSSSSELISYKLMTLLHKIRSGEICYVSFEGSIYKIYGLDNYSLNKNITKEEWRCVINKNRAEWIRYLLDSNIGLKLSQKNSDIFCSLKNFSDFTDDEIFQIAGSSGKEDEINIKSSQPIFEDINGTEKKFIEAISNIIISGELLPAFCYKKIEQDEGETFDLASLSLKKNKLKNAASSQVTLESNKKAHLHVFTEYPLNRENFALVIGAAEKDRIPLVRVHAACYTGDVLHSLTCDCYSQLQLSLQQIKEYGYGILLYLNQDGRGIGIKNKIRTYCLQRNLNLNTIEANFAMGLPDDVRDFSIAAEMLEHFKIDKINLLTNNPKKAADLSVHGIKIAATSKIIGEINEFNEKYLAVKRDQMDHEL